MGGDHSKEGKGGSADLRQCLLCCYKVILLSPERETPLQVEIYLISVNVSYKGMTSQISDLYVYLLFLKNNQPKIILKPKGLTLGWLICSPSLLSVDHTSSWW